MSTTTEKLTGRELKLLTIAIFMGIGAFFGIDVFIPSLPSMTTYFHTSQHTVQLAVTFYMLGGAITQLWYGPLSDAYGRRPVLQIGFVIAIVGTLLCLIAPNVKIFLLGRIIAGIGMGSAFALMRTLVSDLFDKQKFAIYGSYISLVIGLGTLVGPVVGGYLQKGFGWHSTFVFLLLMYLVGILCYQFFGFETIREKQPNAAKAKHLINNYSVMIRNKSYMIYASMAGLGMACLITYSTISAHMLMVQYGLSPVVYGWVGFIVAIGSVIGKSINTQVVKRSTPRRSLTIGFSVILIAGLLLGAGYVFNLLNAELIVALVTLTSLGTGFIFVNASVGAITEFKYLGGSASALYSAWVFFATFIVSTIAALIKSHGALILAIIYLIVALVSLTLLRALKHHESSHP